MELMSKSELRTPVAWAGVYKERMKEVGVVQVKWLCYVQLRGSSQMLDLEV